MNELFVVKEEQWSAWSTCIRLARMHPDVNMASQHVARKTEDRKLLWPA